MARAVGLDIGSRFLKIVELGGSAKGFKVSRAIVRPVPPGTGEEADAALTELIRSIFDEAKLPKDDVCVSFDAATTILREITVPFHDDAQIEKVVRFEAENHLHGRAIEDVVVNWVKTGTTREGSQLLIFASPKAELGRRLAIVRRAGVEPASVDLDATALYSACESSGVFRDHPNVAIVEIGARTTNLLVVDGGRLRVVRSFRAGVEMIGAALSTDLDLPPGDAAARALKPPGPDPDALLVPAADAAPAAGEATRSLASLESDAAESRRGDFARKLQRELTRSLAGARGENPPERVLVAGGGSLLPGLSESLQAHLGLPVEPLDILGRLGTRPSAGSESPEFLSAVSAVAVGCGARVLGVDPLHVELRREEFAPTNTFDVVKTPLAVAVSILFCVLLALSYVAKERLAAEKRAFARVVANARTIFTEAERKYNQHVLSKDEGQARALADAEAKRISQNDPNALRTMLYRLQSRHQRLEGELGLSKDIPQIRSALEAWVEIYKALQTLDRKSLGFFRVNMLSIQQTTATMSLELDDLGVVDRVETALGSSDYLKERAKDPRRVVRRGPVSNTPQNRVQATLDFEFREDTR